MKPNLAFLDNVSKRFPKPNKIVSFIDRSYKMGRLRKKFLIDGMGTMSISEERKLTIAREMASLQGEVDDLRKLVNTLLTIIMEEEDGVQSGAAPVHAGTPRAGISM